MAANVHSFAVGGAIGLRRPWRRVLSSDTKDKIIFKSLIDKCQPVQKLNRITSDDRRFASPPAAAKLLVTCWHLMSSRFNLPSFLLFQECGHKSLLSDYDNLSLECDSFLFVLHSNHQTCRILKYIVVLLFLHVQLFQEILHY